MPMIAARTAVSHVEKMNVKPTVNGRSVSGSILTKVARIHDSGDADDRGQCEDRHVRAKR